MSGVAHAAVTAVDAEPESATIQLDPAATSTSHTINGTYTGTGTDTEKILFTITAGPNADKAGNGALADGECTKNTTAKTFTCTYTSSTPGTDTIRIFADNNANNVFDTGEPFDDVTRTWAGAVATVTMTPEADQAAVGTCNPFTVTVRDAGGNPNPSAPVDVILDPRSDTQKVGFCTFPAAGQPPAEGESKPAGTTVAGANQHSEFITDGAGQVTFGVNADTPGVIDIRAFFEPAGTGRNNTFQDGEPTDTSVKTFVAGGPNAVTTVDAEPESDTNFTTETHTITATLTNASGDTIAGVIPNIDITAGPNAAVNPTCGASNQAGVATCTYPGTTAGTDTIVVWVNKVPGDTAGLDANEASDTVQKTWQAAPTGLTIALTCAGTSANTTTSQCVNPTDDPDEVFTAKVTSGSATGPAASGVLVRFNFVTRTGGATDATVTPAECTTGTNGTCTTTVNNPNPANNDSVTVRAKIAGTPGEGTEAKPDAAGSAALATKTWQTRSAKTITLTPALATNQTRTSHTVTATVTDQFGTAVAGANVDFTVAGRNTSGTTGFDRTTDASGKATFTYTDLGVENAEGTDTITALADVVTENDQRDGTTEPVSEPATKRWIPEATTPADVEIDMVECDAEFATTSPFAPSKNDDTATNALGGTRATTVPPKAATPPSLTHEVCAIVRTAGGDRLLGSTVTFTSTGPGHFASGLDAANHTDRGTTTTATVDSTGRARVFLHSTQTGTQTITATAGSQSDTGTKTWTNVPEDARNIDVSPNVATNRPGEPHAVTAFVTDRFGNPVSGVAVTFTETGPGSFTGTPGAVEPGTVSGTTAANGRVTVETSNTTNQEGVQTIVGRIAADATDCEEEVQKPTERPGATAGNCSESVTKLWSTTGGPTAGPGTFFPLDPARIFDTRSGTGTTTGKMGPGTERVVDVTGAGGVPATGVSSVVVNLTITEGTSNTFLSVTPNGGSATSSLNVIAGETRANLVKVAVGDDGNIRVFNKLGSAHVIMDVFGYYSDTRTGGSRFNPVGPTRIADTRTASATGTVVPPGKLGAGAANEKTVKVTGAGGVPATGATAVALNVTVTEGTAPSFLGVTPTGGGATSNINFSVNQDIPNMVIVRVGPDGTVRVHNGAGQVNFIFDVVGWYGDPEATAGSRFVPLDPQRILDTRSGAGTFSPAGKLGAGAANQKTVNVVGVGGVPSTGVSAVVVNLTGTEGTANTFLTISPGGGGTTSNLNLPGGQDKAVLAIVPVDANGDVKIFNAVGQIHVVLDVVGFFGP